MEGGKKSGSGSSFTTDLFGSKDSPVSSSSSGIFGSIFAPPGKASGRESLLHPGVVERKLDSASQAWNTKNGPSEDGVQVKDGKNASNNPGKEHSSYYQEGRVHQPCHLSSSIYYGGQEVYSRPQSTNSYTYPTFSKDAVEDDSGATRGNWWQGSLYY